MDYRPALLWVMGRLERATPSQALAEFERALGDLIPSEHREQNESGNIKWEWYVRWARQNLVNAGLMESGGRGIWTITPEGQQWLAEHPDGGWDQLKAQVGAARKGRKQDRVVFRAQVEREAVDESRPEHQPPLEFTVAGHRYRLSAQQVLEKARQAIADDIPPEAKRYKKWVADVDGQPVSVKWLFSLATGLGTRQFKTLEARRVLRRMGLEIRSMRQGAPPQPSGVPTIAPPGDALSQQEFLDQVMQKALTAVPLPSRPRGRRPAQPPDDAERRYKLLEAEVRAIRDFLEGNSAGRPGDERLCYWIYLCLTLELHREGWQLFTHVDPSQIPKSLYERTSRFAQACRMRAEAQA